MICKVNNLDVRFMLFRKAIEHHSVNSKYHEYDMEYISKLDLDNIDNVIYKKMEYYLFNKEGINAEQHIEILEKLADGIIVDDEQLFSDYLTKLEKKIDTRPDEIIKSSSKKSKILILLKK